MKNFRKIYEKLQENLWKTLRKLMENFMNIFEKFFKNLWNVLPKIIEYVTKINLFYRN